MSINSLIAAGSKPVAQRDLIADYANVATQRNQNALADRQAQEYAYKQASRNALNEAYAAENAQPGSGAAILAARGQGAEIPAMQTTRTAQEAAELANKDAASKFKKEKLAAATKELDYINPASPSAPAQLMNWFDRLAADPEVGAAYDPNYVAEKRQEIAEISKNPQAFTDYYRQLVMGAKEFTQQNKPTLTNVNTGDKGYTQAVPGLGGAATVVPGSEFTEKLTPQQRAQIDYQNKALAQQERIVNTRAAGKGDNLDPEEEARLKARGTARGKLEVKQQEAEDLRKGNATSMLNLIDEIETPDEKFGGRAAIDAATGSGIGNLVDKGARLFGASTEGAKAAAQLAVVGNRLTLLGDKPSGAISNYEMGILSQAAGQLQDPNIPNEQKKAALSTVKNIMRGIQARGGAQVADPYRGRSKPTSGTASTAPANRPPLTDILGE